MPSSTGGITMTTRLKVDLSTGSVEVEGEEAFVERIYQDFKERLKPPDAAQIGKPPRRSTADSLRAEAPKVGIAAFATLAECLAAARPKTDPEKALVACAYYQLKNGLEDFDAQSVNKELKNTGHTVANITDALDSTMNHEPKLIIQLRKSGTTRQARKKYKVTGEGFGEVARMIAAPTEQPE